MKLLEKEHFQASIWITKPILKENSRGLTKIRLISSITPQPPTSMFCIK